MLKLINNKKHIGALKITDNIDLLTDNLPIEKGLLIEDIEKIRDEIDQDIDNIDEIDQDENLDQVLDFNTISNSDLDNSYDLTDNNEIDQDV